MVSECYTTPQDHATNTMLDTDTVVDTDNVVMHVETAAATSVKSVVVAFQVSALPALFGSHLILTDQVAALACFNHQSKDEKEMACHLERATYTVPNIVKVKLKGPEKQENMKDNRSKHDDIYVNLPIVQRDEKEGDMRDRDPTKLVKIETSNSMKKEKLPNPKHSKKGVTIECQRLNKNKVLEKINVEVSQEVFDALRETNPDMKIKNTITRSWNVLELDSANFHLGKSLQEVKSIFHMLKSWANRASNYKLSTTPKPIVTTL